MMPSPITLIHRALIPMHRFHHVFENRIKKFACVFGITVGQQLHRSFHVREQHRHLFALTFESTLGSQNLFGKMLWRVRFRRRES